MVRRAPVAVVLLSPAYLKSLRGQQDLLLLEHVLGERPELQIIPVVLSDCDWEDYTFLRRFKAWRFPRPLEDMLDPTVAEVLTGIVAAVRSALGHAMGGVPSDVEGEADRSTEESQTLSSATPESVAGFFIKQESEATGGLVFLTSALVDAAWRNRLITASRNDERWPQLNWWYRSRGLEQAQGEQESYAAIRRAKLAVILLSPAYLESGAASAEYQWLLEERQFRKLPVIGLLLKSCAWKQYALLSELQVFSADRPLSEAPDRLVAEELAKIIDAISAVEGVAPASEPDGLVLSSSAKDVLRTARRLADQSHRANITTSCLLFAFAERAGSRKDTARFVKDVLDRDEGYARRFHRFLDSTEQDPPGETVSGWEGTFSPNAKSMLEYASVISESVSHGSRLVHARHLFGAVLAAPLVTVPTARILLAQIAPAPITLVAEFLQFVASYAGGDSQDRWRLLLSPEQGATLPAIQGVTERNDESKPVEVFVAGTAGYTSEFCGMGGAGEVMDHLGVEGLAHRLAELIALKETRLPLAIALFGNWGSGKSHFMNLMDRHMDALQSKNEDQWCKQIVPVYFNAWHYSDSNLWASLVTEVFDALFRKLAPKSDELALLQERLREAGGVTTLAAAEVSQAVLGVQQANQTLERAKKDSEQARIALSLAEGLKALLPELNTQENRERVEELLGISVDHAMVADLEKKRKELQSLGGRAKELWRRMTKPEGRWVRAAWFAGAAIMIVLLRLGAGHVPWIEMELQKMGPVARWLTGTILAAAAWMTPYLKQAKESLGQLERWQTKAEKAQEKQPAKERVQAATIGVEEAERRAQKAAETLNAAEIREQQLIQQAEQLKPERRLSNFIEARARSSDYRGQLGLVSLARRDFQQLTEIFTDAEALQRRLQSSPDATKNVEVALNASVDRVVLYIDDLDRCEPEKVVDVLQAVHLLLAYRLFAVVVGVDQRCLRQSLKIRFKGLLAQDAEDATGKHAGLLDADDIPATPLDYLEKIFHIPFHLPPMGKDGFENLVEQLTEPEADTAPPQLFPEHGAHVIRMQTASPKGTEQVKLTGTTNEERSISMPSEGVVTEPIWQPVIGDDEAVEAVVPTFRSMSESKPIAARRVGSVPLQRWERDALKVYHTLIRTPRGATRLLNTYRLVRSNLHSEEWNQFRGDMGGEGQSRFAMLLLAVAAGQPAIARTWFAALRQGDTGSWMLPDAVEGNHALEWDEFKRLCNTTSSQMSVPLTPKLVRVWLDRVERFSF
ncbi:MAG TPA: P-loop NTPase fold protein [Acidobacteriaceae bacterium]